MKIRSTPVSFAPVTVEWAVDREFSHDVSFAISVSVVLFWNTNVADWR